MSHCAVFVAVLLFLLPTCARAQVSASSLWQNTKAGSGTRKSIAFDADGNILVTATNGKVNVFRPSDAQSDGGPHQSISVSATPGLPTALAVDPITGYVYTNLNTTTAAIGVYQYSITSQSSGNVTTITPFIVGAGPFKILDQLCFSPDGGLLFASLSNGTSTGGMSIVRVAARGSGNTWNDTGVVIAPGNNTTTAGNPDPRSNQGLCYGLAADADGNLWVASASDPVVWNGNATYTANVAAYVRPLRYYRRQADGTYVLSAEVPLTQKATGLSLASDGTLYVTEGRTVTQSGTESTSHRIHIYRGLERVGTIETAPASGDKIWNLQSVAVSPDGHATVVGNLSNGTGTAAMQQWSVSGLPSLATATVQGRISDATTGKPVAGARVWLLNQQTLSDTAGNYALTAPVTGTLNADPYHIITVDAPGYRRTQRRPVRFSASVFADLPLVPATAAASGMSYFVETNLGAVETQAGLFRMDAASGDTTVVSVDPGTANARAMGATTTVLDPNANGNNMQDRLIFFDVDDVFAAPAGPAFVTVRWYDAQTDSGTLRVQYQNTAPGAAGTVDLPRASTPLLRSDSVYLNTPNLMGAMDYGASFSLYNATTNPKAILAVAVTRGAPTLKNATPPSFAPGAAALDTTMTTAPLVYDGIIYAGTISGYLYATSASTGQPVSTFGANGQGAVVIPGGPAARPVIFRTPDGKDHLCVLSRRGAVYVLNPKTGAREWSSSSDMTFKCSASPAIYVDNSTGVAVPLVYVAATQTLSGGGTEGHLQRYRLDTGGIATKDLDLTIGTEITSSPALSAGMDNVMVGYTNGADGHVLITDNPRLASNMGVLTPRWDTSVPNEPIKASPTLTGDGRTMLIGSSNGASGHLLAANSANGGVQWTIPMGGVESTPWVDYEAYGNAAQADTAFVCSVDGMIHSIDLNTHAERPGFPIRPVPGTVGGSLMVINRKLYVGCDLGMLVLDPVNPTSLKLFSPAYAAALQPSANGGAIAPGFNVGASASGRAASTSIIAMTGSNGRMYEMYVQ